MNMRALVVSAFCLGSLSLASAAQAATAFIDGNIYWGAGTTSTDFSKAGEIASFSFDVDNPTLDPTTVTDFQYTLNNVAVTDPLSFVTFYPTYQGGLFDLVFARTTVSLFGADIGSSGPVGPSGYYAATANSAGSSLSTGVGGVVVSTGPLSAVPLPAALPLLGTAVAGLGMVARRRKRTVAA